MSAELWPDECVEELVASLRVLHVPALAEWIKAHVMPEDRWDHYAILLASIGAVYIQEQVELRLGKALIQSEQFAGFAPEGLPGEGSAHAAGLALICALNDDTAGVLGIIEGARAADALEDLCGYLVLIAHRAVAGHVVPMRVGGAS
jgi:hypothetical protein